MTKIRFQGSDYGREPGETVLAALRRAGVERPYSCGRGQCQTCLMRALDGAVPEAAQTGLKDTLKAQGYFLPCVCLPDGDLEVAEPDHATVFEPATVVEVEAPGNEVRRVFLRPQQPFAYRSGQFISLRRPDGLTRSYSLASLPGRDPNLEIHVKHHAGGRMSGWIFEDLRAGEELEIQGPNGSCFYLPGRPEQPILLIGTGTGLAPLIGIARDALAQDHKGPIHLYHGTHHAEGLYLRLELEWLAAQHGNFTYVPCLSGQGGGDGCRAGRGDETALSDHPDLSGWRIFLCGAPPMVAGARKRAYLAGADLADIHADAFELCQEPALAAEPAAGAEKLTPPLTRP